MAPRSAFDEEWDRLAGTGDPAPLAIGGCGAFQMSSYNSTYPVRGTVFYRDERNPEPPVALQESEYPGRLTTRVEYEDNCGNLQVRNVWWHFTTGAFGAFSHPAVQTVDDPAWGNPIVSFTVTAPDVGLRTCTGTCGTYTTVEQTLESQHHGFQFVNGELILSPEYNIDNSVYPYFFRWNEVVKSLKRRWTDVGVPRLSAAASPFAVAYDNTVAAYFWGNGSPGLVVFGDTYAWSSRWIIAHELGHFLQYKLQSDQLGGGVEHNVCQAIPGQAAFQEGFADWHASYIELNVASYFWDVFDSVNSDPHDRQYSTPPLIDTFQKDFGWLATYWPASSVYQNFGDFFYDFSARGAWGADQYSANELLLTNGVWSP